MTKGDLSISKHEEVGEWKGRWNLIIGREEGFWKQRYHVQWLTKGDRKMVFFHKKESNHMKRNIIRKHFDFNNVDLTNEEDIGAFYTRYIYKGES